MAFTTAQEFRDFYAKIPNEKWTTGYYTCPKDGSKHCARGHLLALDPDEDGWGLPQRRTHGAMLSMITEKHRYTLLEAMPLTHINDYKSDLLPQETPKARVLAALDLIIAKEAGNVG